MPPPGAACRLSWVCKGSYIQQTHLLFWILTFSFNCFFPAALYSLQSRFPPAREINFVSQDTQNARIPSPKYRDHCATRASNLKTGDPPGAQKWWGPGTFHIDPRPPCCWLGGFKVQSSPCLAQLLTQLSSVTNLPSRAVTLFTRRQTCHLSAQGTEPSWRHSKLMHSTVVNSWLSRSWWLSPESTRLWAPPRHIVGMAIKAGI